MNRDGPLNVLVVAACPFPQPRGTPVRILRLSEAVARLGHRVRVLAYHLGEGDVPSVLDVRRIPRVATYRKTSPGPSLQKLLIVDPILARTLRGMLREGPVDVIHAHHYEGLLTALWGRDGSEVPIVYDAHTMLSTELTGYRLPLPSAWLRSVGRRIDRTLPGRADHIVAVTDAIGHKLRGYGVPADRITVASQGVEEEFFVPLAEDVPREPGDSPTLVYAGNLATYQGIETLLESLARVRVEYPRARLRLLTGSSFAPYEDRARRLGVREAVDVAAVSLEALPAAIRAADVTLNPRVRCDGIPVKLLNYMAAARPVVSFEGSAPIVRHGETGLLARGASVDAFAGAILEALADPDRARRIGLAGRRYAETHHRWERIAALVEDVYRGVLDA